jgi:hypothetical protein
MPVFRPLSSAGAGRGSVQRLVETAYGGDVAIKDSPLTGYL